MCRLIEIERVASVPRCLLKPLRYTVGKLNVTITVMQRWCFRGKKGLKFSDSVLDYTAVYMAVHFSAVMLAMRKYLIGPLAAQKVRANQNCICHNV